MATAQKSTTSTKGSTTGGFTADEKTAMRERAKEAKAEAKRGADRDAGLKDLLEKIAEMPDDDRKMAEQIHAIVTDVAPNLRPKTWYGMPAWADDDGKAVCFFTPAAKFKERYASFGFNANANLDEGSMWPTAWALTKLSRADEQLIRELVKKAVS